MSGSCRGSATRNSAITSSASTRTCLKSKPCVNGGIPIYEPGLQELSAKNTAAGRLSYTTDLRQAVEQVGHYHPRGRNAVSAERRGESLLHRPSGRRNRASDERVQDHCREKHRAGRHERTASPSLIRRSDGERFDSISLPEFLREGSAVQDTLHPDRIVIGADSQDAAETMVRLHKPLTDQIVVTDIRSAEMIKYASNAFLGDENLVHQRNREHLREGRRRRHPRRGRHGLRQTDRLTRS